MTRRRIRSERENPPITPVLEFYGAVGVQEDRHWHKVRCPFHDDRTASASVDTIENVYKCFACDYKGSALNLIMMKEGLDYAGATNRYVEIAGEGNLPLRTESRRQRRKPLSGESLDYEGSFNLLSSGLRRRPPAGT